MQEEKEVKRLAREEKKSKKDAQSVQNMLEEATGEDVISQMSSESKESSKTAPVETGKSAQEDEDDL